MPLKEELADGLSQIGDLADAGLDPENTREEAIAKLKQISDITDSLEEPETEEVEEEPSEDFEDDED